VEKFYNRYHPFVHKPLEGNPTKVLAFLDHVFGEQLDTGLDYFKVLLLYPTQMLPILCLVSRERNTGKTTFLNFLKAVFGDNMTINSNEDFRSNFNAEWANKLIIGVDETFLDRKEDSEGIKSLSTSKYYKIEAKGIDRQEIEFFGKFVLCSNNEDSFIQVDTTEIRYWIRKLPVLKQDDPELLSQLKKEIPFFVNHLINRPFNTQPTTRMWFTANQIATASLQHIKRCNRNKLQFEMAQILLHILDSKEVPEEICFCTTDMQGWLQGKGITNRDANAIRKVLQEEWGLKPSANSNAYLQYRIGSDGVVYEYNQKGRFYSIKKRMVLDLNYLDETDEP
jgi:hypothetical protein